MRKTFEQGELITARDYHHNGFSTYGWDGESLWIKATYVGKKWTKVNKIKLTTPRYNILMELTKGKVFDYIKIKDGSYSRINTSNDKFTK